MKKKSIPFFLLSLLLITTACMLTDQLFSPQKSSQNAIPKSELPTLPPATETPIPSPSRTPTITSSPTRNFQATRAVRETNIAASSTNAVLQKTETAKSMADLVESLYDKGFIASKSGEFTRMDDFSEEWAKLDWYQYWYQGDETYADFVLRFSAKMQSASDKANWHHAGCGVVFRHVDNDNHMFLIIAQNGIMSLRKRLKDVVYLVRDSRKYSSQIPVENVEVILVVNGMSVVLFADESLILEVREPILGSTLRQGKLAFSVMSGTNKGYGTRCSMTDIELWQFK